MQLSSRERMMRALRCEEPDRIPLSFMIYAALRRRCRDDFDFVERQLDMGLDATVPLKLPSEGDRVEHGDLPGLPIRYHPDVEVVEWQDEDSDGTAVLHKEYHTPSGVLSTAVNRTGDWPYGEHVPLFDDYLCPRSRKFLIEGKQDLEALRYLLIPPREDDVRSFREESKERLEFAASHGLLVTGERGIGMDASAWLCGFREVAIAAMRRPEFVDQLAKMLHEWNCHRMKVFLDAGVDLFIRRGWYEGTDFWSPRLYRRFILPYLEREVRMAHSAEASFGYIMTSGSMPLLDMLAETGIDVLVGVDPIQGKGTDLGSMKRTLQGRVCLWGGVNGFITMETGTESEVVSAAREAVDALAPSGGFILSPVDNVRDDSPRTRENVESMIDAWRELRAYPAHH
jgi:hypothetical protein